MHFAYKKKKCTEERRNRKLNADSATKRVEEHEPDGNVVMSDESQFVFLLTEMVDQQREPDNQGRGSNNHSQGHQGQVLLTGGETQTSA